MTLDQVRQALQELDSLSGELALLPTGSLIIHRRASRSYYSHQFYLNGKRFQKYIRLADLQDFIAQLQRRRSICRRLQGLRSRLKHHCRLVHQIRKEQRLAREFELQRQKARQTADQLPFGAQCLHRTLRGEFVASKSEVILADYYYLKGIDYLYSPELRLEGRTFYPDFVLLIDGQRIYHEHLGLLEEPEYARRWEAKREAYRQFGIIEEVNLICTREVNGIIDMSEIHRLLETQGIRKK